MGVLALLSIQFGKTGKVGIVIAPEHLEAREPCSLVYPAMIVLTYSDGDL
jgi:hypothetical protein